MGFYFEETKGVVAVVSVQFGEFKPKRCELIICSSFTPCRKTGQGPNYTFDIDAQTHVIYILGQWLMMRLPHSVMVMVKRKIKQDNNAGKVCFCL